MLLMSLSMAFTAATTELLLSIRGTIATMRTNTHRVKSSQTNRQCHHHNAESSPTQIIIKKPHTEAREKGRERTHKQRQRHFHKGSSTKAQSRNRHRNSALKLNTRGESGGKKLHKQLTRRARQLSLPTIIIIIIRLLIIDRKERKERKRGKETPQIFPHTQSDKQKVSITFPSRLSRNAS